VFDKYKTKCRIKGKAVSIASFQQASLHDISWMIKNNFPLLNRWELQQMEIV
jgi:hypothetical protein